MMQLLKEGKLNEPEKTVTLSAETFNKILDMVYILQEEGKWSKLGILAETAVPDNEVKLKILSKLQNY